MMFMEGEEVAVEIKTFIIGIKRKRKKKKLKELATMNENWGEKELSSKTEEKNHCKLQKFFLLASPTNCQLKPTLNNIMIIGLLLFLYFEDVRLTDQTFIMPQV